MREKKRRKRDMIKDNQGRKRKEEWINMWKS